MTREKKVDKKEIEMQNMWVREIPYNHYTNMKNE